MKSKSYLAGQAWTRSTLGALPTYRAIQTCLFTLLHQGCIGLIVLGSALIGISTGGEASISPPVLPVPPVVMVTPDGLLVDWRAPEARLGSRADGTLEVLLPGYTQTTLPGAPRLPFMDGLVALPPNAVPTFQVILVEETAIPLPGPLALAPVPAGVQRDAVGNLIGGDFSPAISIQPAQSRAGEPIQLELAGVVRGVRLARLVFYPARPTGSDPQARLRVTTHVRVSITFTLPAALPPSTPLSPQPSVLAQASPDPILAALRLVVINPTQVPSSTFIPPLSPSTLPSSSFSLHPSSFILHPSSFSLPPSAWIIEVATPGLTAITYEALAAVDFPVASTDPHRLHLARAGTEIAAAWDGDADASFGPGERLLFYAEPRFSRWTSTDIYFLWQDTSPGLRMQNRPAVPTGQPVGSAWADATAEANQLYTPDCFCGSIPPGRDGDHWTWDDLKRPGHSTASYPIELPVVDATHPATLTVWLIGYTDVAANPDHRVEVDLNGAPLGQIKWDGKQAITTTLPILPGILHSDANTLTLTLPGLPGVGIEGAWLDAYSIRYARGRDPFGASAIFTGQPEPHTYTLALSTTTGLRVVDITNPDLPLRLTDVMTDGNTISFSDPFGNSPHRYALMAESGLLFPAAVRPVPPLLTGGGFTGADYILIAPADFIPALDGLITLRQAQGQTVAVENVQAIYANFGDGRPDPAAIRAYLAYAYAAWTPRPTYVLLVGDGSFDPRQYRTTSPPTFIPPYLADVDPWAGETAADNRYVTVDGQDTLPDMLIGRLPVKTFTETQTVVDKIVQYEANPFPGGWNENVVFVADNADQAGDFAAQSELIATTYVTSPFTAQRIYFTPPATTITTTRQAVLGHWNAGALIIQFTGHSSWQQWAAERFLHLDDLPALRNDRRWPIVLEMTCFTGAFQRPEPTLDEGLLTLNGGGSVAAWSATGLGVSTGHTQLDEGFFRAVFSDTVSGAPLTIGLAALAGKLTLAAAGQNLDLLDTFTLLGDPALRLNQTIIPWASRIYLPVVIRN